jgi:E3 ubiquitin-protein ligase SHPRH
MLPMIFFRGVYIERYHQPKTLAQFDVVITTYEVLTKEFDYVDLPHCNAADGRRFRNAKRYSSVPSPLTCIEWWRICLDEAQMVDCTTTRTAKMALRLNTVHRWCITGTPINRSLQGLHFFTHYVQYLIKFQRNCFLICVIFV